MSRTFLLGDVVAAVNNARAVRKDSVTVPHSAFVANIFDILVREGYFTKSTTEDLGNNKKAITIGLKYVGKKDLISEFEIISRPSRRVYVAKEDVKQVIRGKGLAVVSTSKGLFTDKEARKAGVGGELLVKVW
jgi:small subunit ribosomal protein S8